VSLTPWYLSHPPTHNPGTRTLTAGRAMSCCTEGRAAARVVSMVSLTPWYLSHPPTHNPGTRTLTAGRAMSCCTEGRAAARVVSMAATVSRRSTEYEASSGSKVPEIPRGIPSENEP
jgi:hypothetical protein